MADRKYPHAPIHPHLFRDLVNGHRNLKAKQKRDQRTIHIDSEILMNHFDADVNTTAYCSVYLVPKHRVELFDQYNPY